MSLAAKLRNLRAKKGDSLQTAADAVGISKAHFWELEVGKSKNPSADLLQKIGAYFKVSVASLLGEDPKSDDDAHAVAMFRNIKQLDPEDREMVEAIIEQYKKRKSGRDKD